MRLLTKLRSIGVRPIKKTVGKKIKKYASDVVINRAQEELIVVARYVGNGKTIMVVK